MYRFIILLIIICIGMTNHINAFIVKSIDELKNDISARTNSRVDKNNNPCALVRLNLPTLDQLTFGNMVVGEVSQLPGEYILYLSPDTKQLTYSVKGVENTIDFSDYNIDIEGKNTYRIILKEDNAPTSASTSAYITANYDNQIVLVDGIPMGETPVLIESIEPGKHTIGIPNTNGITMKDTTVLISAGEKNDINLKLKKKKPEIISVAMYGSDNDSYGWYPVWGLKMIKKGNKEGIIDLTGREIVPPIYDAVDIDKLENCGAYIVRNGEFGGLYHPDRGLIVPCEYITFASRGNEIILAANQNEEWVGLNNKGDVVIPFLGKYPFLPEASEDYFIVNYNINGGDEYGIIDLQGNVVFEPQYDFLGEINEGFCTFVKTNSHYYDTTGVLDVNTKQEINLPSKYRLTETSLGHIVSNGCLIVEEKGSNGAPEKFGALKVPYMTPSIQTQYDHIDEYHPFFVDGCALLESNNQIYVVDPNGNIIITDKGNHIKDVKFNTERDPQSDDYLHSDKIQSITLKYDNGTNEVIDKYGSTIIPKGLYKRIEAFNDNGKAFYAGLTDKEWHVLDGRGTTLFSIPCDEIEVDGESTNAISIRNIKDGFVLIVRTDEKDELTYGYMNLEGDLLVNMLNGNWRDSSLYNTKESDEEYNYTEFANSIETEYSLGDLITGDGWSHQSHAISEGCAIVNIGDRFGMINNKGDYVLPLIYTGIIPFVNGVSFARDQSGKWHKIYRKDLK